MAAFGYPVVLCNMCMIEDGHGRVLVQHRRPKASNSWHGLAFPGGHVENGESVTAPSYGKLKRRRDLSYPIYTCAELWNGRLWASRQLILRRNAGRIRNISFFFSGQRVTVVN